MAAATADTEHLTLASLLDPLSWNLPGWNDSHTSGLHNEPPGPDTLNRLDVSLALLMRYRNTLRPSHRLSPDILLLIFLQLWKEECDPYSRNFGSYSWMTATQVCFAWREIALSSPLLWTHLSTRYPTAASICLERSADAPITLVVTEGSEGSNKVTSLVEAVSSHVWRLRHLYLPSDILKPSDGNLHRLLQPIVRSAAPSLETLMTSKVRGVGGWSALPTLFAAHTPRLTTLRVHYMYPELHSLSLSNLKTLYFCGKKRDVLTLKVTSLFDILEACPLLEVFKIEKVTWTEVPDVESRLIRLDHLRYLELARTPASLVADILSHLIIPECAMRIKVWMDRYEDSKFHIGIPTDDRVENPCRPRDIRKMHVHYLNGYEGVAIHGSCATQPFEFNGLLEQSTIDNLGDMDAIAGTVFQSIARSFDMDSLEEFAITEMRSNARWTGFSRKVWADTFQRMPNLKKLYMTLDGCYDEGFSRSILAALSTPDDKTGKLPCPQLESICVWGDKTWSSLQCYSMAEEREKSGHRLKRVSMRLAHYSSFNDPADTDLPLLRRCVDVVDLDPVDIELPGFPDEC